MELVGFIIGMVIGIAAVAGLFIILVIFKRRRDADDISQAVEASHSSESRKSKTRRTKNQDASSSLAPSPTSFMAPDEDSVIDVDGNQGSSVEYSLEDGAAGSFSTVDYDYAKARDNSSIVSSVGGTLGELTQNSVGNSVGTFSASLSSQREYSARSSFDDRLGGGKTALPAGKSKEGDYFKVKLPESTKALGMVIHSAADMNIGAIPAVIVGPDKDGMTDCPIVHALKESSPLIALGVRTGDLLIRVNQKSVVGGSALEVSKIIRTQMGSAEGCTLTFFRVSSTHQQQQQQQPQEQRDGVMKQTPNEIVWNT